MFKAAAGFFCVLGLAAGLGFAQPALAGAGADISTPAWSNHPLPLRAGPGDNFQIRTVLPGGIRVSVDRCSVLWCHVHAGRASGFAFQYSLSFGQGPNSIWWPPQVRHPGVRAFTYERQRPSF